jgi:hypothetical protein
MNRQSVIPSNKAAGGLVATAVAACSFAAAARPAPAANATCASFSGINFGSGCTSTLGGMAIAIGAGATAEAAGFLSTAIAMGTNVTSTVRRTLNLAAVVGTHSTAAAGDTSGTDFGNVATNLGNDSMVDALGVLNTASNTGGGNSVAAQGVANNASNLGGGGNIVEAVSNAGTLGFNRAFAIFATNTTVVAFPGPLALAGSIFQNGVTVNKKGPGFNINGLQVGGAAAPTTAKSAAAGGRTSLPVRRHLPSTSGKSRRHRGIHCFPTKT